jgi:hypothetical protein
MKVNMHMLWLWGWYIVGGLAGMFKRAYFKVEGPDTAVPTYRAYFGRYWPPLLFRALAGAAVYWLTFTPELLSSIIKWVGLNYEVPVLPGYGVVALIAGLAIDSVLDMITTKVPGLQGQIPQDK